MKKLQTSNKLRGLKNLGPTIIKRLNEVGIYTKEDLRRIGPAVAYKRIKTRAKGVTVPVCYYLYSLEGALRNVHWDDVPEHVKKQLLLRIQEE